MELTQDEVLQIIKLVEESEFDELDLEMEGLKLVVRKGGVTELAPGAAAAAVTLSSPAPAAKPAVAEKQEKAPAAAPSPKAAETAKVAPAMEPGHVAIVAPTVGTFYRAPKPGAPPFVQVGSFVTEEDTVCILEVMKCFISVKSGAKGYVTRISAQNEELVEFGQELFRIKVAEKAESAAS